MGSRTTGPLGSGPHAPQSLEVHITQVKAEVEELEARAGVVYRYSMESVEQAAEYSIAD